MIGKIEIKQPVQAIPIAAPVLSKSPLKWSEDNAISLATHFGTCIFTLNISPYADQAGILYERTYISPPSTANTHILSGQNLLKLVHSLDCKDAHKIMLDATLTAAHRAGNEIPSRGISQLGYVPGQNGEENYLGFSNSAWSYKGAVEGDRCMLCLVTFDHQVLLVGQAGMKWKILKELTEIWAEYASNKGKKMVEDYQNTLGTEKHHHFVAKTRFLSIKEIQWTSNIKGATDDDFSVLMLITASSHLCLFKIPTFECGKTFNPVVLECFALNRPHKKVMCLHWFQLNAIEGIITIGTVEGSIEMYHLGLEPECSFEVLYSFENLAIGMAVNHLNLCCIDEKNMKYVLYAGKHNILMGYLLQIDLPSVNLLASTHSMLGCLSISAIQVMNSTAYVSLKDGKIVEVHINCRSDPDQIEFDDIRYIFSSEEVLYNGFCFSPNAAFLAILECVSVPYDHLQLREPTVISLFQVNTFTTVLQCIVEETSKPLSFQVDACESLRLLSYLEEKARFPKIRLRDIPLLGSHLKKIHLWVAAIEQSFLNERDKSSDSKLLLGETMDALEESILSDYISELFSSFKKEQLPEDEMHRLSLYNMCNFFQDNKIKHPNLKKIKLLLKKTKVKGGESCLVCSSPAEFKSIKFSKCSKGHTLPRCLRTLLSTFPVYNCIHCNLFFHPDASKWYGAEGKKCLICSRKLINKVGMRSTAHKRSSNS